MCIPQTINYFMSNVTVPRVSVKVCLDLLANGYTRWEADATEPGKSIETYYKLRNMQAKELFARPELKGIKTKHPILIIEDENGGDTIVYSAEKATSNEVTVAPATNEASTPDVQEEELFSAEHNLPF